MAYAFKRTKNRDDALDLVQNTYMRAIRHNNSYQNKEYENLGSWLMSILKNLLKDYYSELVRINLDDTPYEKLEETEVPPIIDNYQEGKIFKDSYLDYAFHQLTPYQQNVIYNTYVLDIDDEAQSKALGIPKRTLVSRRKKGMDQLKKWLGAKEISLKWKEVVLMNRKPLDLNN